MNIDNLNIKQLLIILGFSIFIFGLITGIIIGEYQEMKFINTMMNNSANSNHLIGDGKNYYQIENYNMSKFKECYRNISCLSEFINQSKR